MAQLRMRQPTETFIDAFADTTSALETASSEGLRAQSTDTAPAMPALLAAADALLPTAPADTNKIPRVILLTDGDDLFFLSDIYSPNYIFLVSGMGGNDNITGYIGNDIIYGGDGNDYLSGYAGTDTLEGGDGNDYLIAGDNYYLSSTSVLLGGAGNDLLAAGRGYALLDGGDGFDTVDYEPGTHSPLDAVTVNLADPSSNRGVAAGHTYSSIEEFYLSLYDDIFIGADAADIVHGVNGDDHLLGQGGSDSLDGGDGADILLGGNGDDLLYGGNDNDLLIGGAGADALSGGDGYDIASYEDAAGISIDLTKPSSTWTGDAQGDVLTSIEEITLSRFDDTFISASTRNFLFVFGGYGDDYLDGSSGNDSFDGGPDNDSLFGEAGHDRLDGSDGNDRLDGGAGNDTLFAGAGNDVLSGGDDNDRLSGDNGNDDLDGGAGNDLLSGGAGADALRGGDGFDTATYVLALSSVFVDLADPSLNAGDAVGDSYASIEQFALSSYDDIFIGADAADSVNGLSGSDILFGGGGGDVLNGGLGDDWLDGGAGADTLSGGDGYDVASYLSATAGVTIDLTKASSTWTGDAQGDVLSGIEEFVLSEFADIFRGDASANTVSGGSGNDQIFGAGGNDFLTGDEGNDIIQGGEGNDVVHGDTDSVGGDDYLQGNAGNDVLFGGYGTDRIVGGTGNDTVVGGLGGDFLSGNEGADIFQYTSVEESQNIVINGVSQLDQIADFTQGQDKIDLFSIDANPALAGDQAFVFITDPAHYTGDWTGVVWQTTNPQTGITTINVSVDGDADAEMQIYMSHPYQFTANDFIL
jgi:Ca2+-binding RTX toxin-like protein